MDSDELSNQKAALRKSMKAIRAEAFQTVQQPEAKLWQNLKSFFDTLPPKSTIGGYVPIQTEFPTWNLLSWLEEAGHDLALPLVTGEAKPLTFLSWSTDAPLISGAFGAKTPDPDKAQSVVPNILLVPLLAFDAKGFRLGYGGGFYDRSIALYKPELTIGIAFKDQAVETVPIGAYDLALTHIATEAGFAVTNT